MATNETSEPSTSSSTSTETTESNAKKPICVILLGMAGSGKSSLCSRLTRHLFDNKSTPYVINCDPACLQMPYVCNIDIRDTVNYKQVMKQYNLGPNGAIITSLNLFATQLDQVIGLIDKRSQTHEYVVFDTPGQIEVFTWSASGAIITEALASRYPTVIIYVMDTVRSNNPITFMSNMLYACSILYKYKLPLIIALNKSDVIDYKFAIDWMKDWESFQTAIDKETSYMANLTRSMALALDSFYENISAIGVSAVTGLGLDQLLIAIKEAAVEYERDYRPEYERIKKETERERIRQREQQLKNAVKQSGDGNKVELMTFGEPTDDFFRDNNEDSDEDMITGKDNDQEEDESEKKEYQDFQKFLAMQKASDNIQ